MQNRRDPGFIKWQESIDQRLEPAVQRAKELYNKYKAEIDVLFDKAYINLKEKAIKENRRVVLVQDILAEILNYQSFLDFCKTDEGAYALLEKEIRTGTKNTLIIAMFEEIRTKKPTTIKLFFGVSESISKNALDETIRDIPTESQEEYEIAQELELRGIALALKAEMDMGNSSEHSLSKKICLNKDSGKILESLSKNSAYETTRSIPIESHAEHENARESESFGFDLGLRDELVIDKSSEYSNQKRMREHENPGKITKKIKLSEDKLLNKSDSKANSDLEDAIDEEIE